MDDELYIEIRKPADTDLSPAMADAIQALASAMAAEGDEVAGFDIRSVGDLGMSLRGPEPQLIVWCGGTYAAGKDGKGPQCSGGYLKFP